MATIGLRALVMICGAGYTGSYLYNNLDSTRALAARILQLSKSDSNQNGPSSAANTSGSSTTVDALAKQLESLSRELTRSRSTPVVVMPSGRNGVGMLGAVSDALNLLGWGVVLVSIGGVGYYVAVKRNLKFKDLVWVSRARFNETVAAMETGIARMRGMVGAVKRELGERFRILDGRVEEVREVGERIGIEVSEVKDGVVGLGEEMWAVKGALDGVGDRVDMMDGKLDHTNRGIYALIKVVYAAVGGGGMKTDGLVELEKYMLDMGHEVANGNNNNAANGGPRVMQRRLSVKEDDGNNISRGLLSCLEKAGVEQVHGPGETKAKAWAGSSVDGVNKSKPVASFDVGSKGEGDIPSVLWRKN